MFAVGAEVQIVHGDEDSPLAGLEAIADIGQGPVHDGAHGVGEVTILQFLLDLEVFNSIDWRDGISHKYRLFSHFRQSPDGYKIH